MTAKSTIGEAVRAFGLAASVGSIVFLFACCDSAGDREEDALLARANQYLVNGFVDEAESLFDQVLARDEQNAEALLQKSFCAQKRGAIDVAALLKAVDGSDAEALPPGFGDLARARILVLENERDTARQFFERAAAKGVERVRQAVLHEVDYLRQWSATKLFSVAARFPIIEEKGRALSRLTFRPLETARLTAFVCTPGGNARLVFPRAGRKTAVDPADDRPCPAGGALLVEFFRDSGEWIFLPSNDESFLCALATEGSPDRERARALLLEILRAGGGGPQCVAALEAEFGAGRALFVSPEPF